jgi:predicted O-methyltransferase YrrM
MNYNAEYNNWYEKIPNKYYTHPIPSDFNEIFGYCNFHELYHTMVTHVQNNSVMVEVGVLAGHSAGFMATLIKQSKKNIKFYTVDPHPDLYGQEAIDWYSQEFEIPMYDLFLRNMKSIGVLDYITPLRLPSTRAANLFDDNSIDFIFIDGDHATQAVIDDINAWLPKMKTNSVISGHDYDHSTVKEAVDECFKNKDIHLFNTSWIVGLGTVQFET